jgi:26S proteasome regulatory subunit N2
MFRNQVLASLVKMYRALPEPDYFSVSQCLLWLGDSQSLASILSHLLKDGKKPEYQLIAYQIAFDVYEYGTQEFRSKLIRNLTATDAKSNSMDTDKSSDHWQQKILLILNGNETIKLQLE